MRIRTISYGKDKPADPANNEAAWAKNRRGDFVLLHPKSGA
jgi:peptidoglycan-associated lipoprotein